MYIPIFQKLSWRTIIHAGYNFCFQKENVLTIPNLLTMSRIGLTPLLGYLIVQQNYPVACGLFVFAGVTDLVSNRRQPFTRQYGLTHWPWEIWMKFFICNFQKVVIDDWDISCEIALIWMSLDWWYVNIGSGNGLVPSGSKPLPELMMTQISIAIWCH